ncbi:MAG: hypothetical protein H6707_11520 [Deltaproteobacteria bacterium]|nr:hypothetical protein [Deltaproteobacteria bacterium]
MQQIRRASGEKTPSDRWHAKVASAAVLMLALIASACGGVSVDDASNCAACGKSETPPAAPIVSYLIGENLRAARPGHSFRHSCDWAWREDPNNAKDALTFACELSEPKVLGIKSPTTLQVFNLRELNPQSIAYEAGRTYLSPVLDDSDAARTAWLANPEAAQRSIFLRNTEREFSFDIVLGTIDKNGTFRKNPQMKDDFILEAKVDDTMGRWRLGALATTATLATRQATTQVARRIALGPFVLAALAIELADALDQPKYVDVPWEKQKEKPLPPPAPGDPNECKDDEGIPLRVYKVADTRCGAVYATTNTAAVSGSEEEVHYFHDDCSWLGTVDTRIQPHPQTMDWNLLHEMVHAAVAVKTQYAGQGCGFLTAVLTHGLKVVFPHTKYFRGQWQPGDVTNSTNYALFHACRETGAGSAEDCAQLAAPTGRVLTLKLGYRLDYLDTNSGRFGSVMALFKRRR